MLFVLHVLDFRVFNLFTFHRPISSPQSMALYLKNRKEFSFEFICKHYCVRIYKAKQLCKLRLLSS
jgi:hypothetical protein